MKRHDSSPNCGTVVGFWVKNLASLDAGLRETPGELIELRARPESIVEIARCTGQTPTNLTQRFDSGACCVSLYVDGVWASSGWVSSGSVWIGELTTWFTPLPDEAYVWDCLTRQQYRGRGLYPRLLRLICQHLARSGHHRVWIATEWKNWRSANGVARAGFSPVGAVVVIRTGAVRRRRLLPNHDAGDDVIAALRHSLESPKRGPLDFPRGLSVGIKWQPGAR